MQKPCAFPVAIVTGSGRRIGRCIASQLFNDGFSLCLHYRHSKIEVEELCQEFNKKRQHSAMTYQADFALLEYRKEGTPILESCATASVSLPSLLQERCEGLIKACMDYFERCDVLVNNASTFLPSPLLSTGRRSTGREEKEKGTLFPTGERKEEEKRQEEDLAGMIFGSNALAPYYLTQYFTRCCEESENSAHRPQRCIINIIDSMLDRPLQGFTLYTMAKRALEGLTTSAALELAPYHIRVNGVAPGLSLLPEESLAKEFPGSGGTAALTASVPLGQKEASGETLAEVVSYLVSPRASYITGCILPVDGGWRLSRRAE